MEEHDQEPRVVLFYLFSSKKKVETRAWIIPVWCFLDNIRAEMIIYTYDKKIFYIINQLLHFPEPLGSSPTQQSTSSRYRWPSSKGSGAGEEICMDNNHGSGTRQSRFFSTWCINTKTLVVWSVCKKTATRYHQRRIGCHVFRFYRQRCTASNIKIWLTGKYATMLTTWNVCAS